MSNTPIPHPGTPCTPVGTPATDYFSFTRWHENLDDILGDGAGRGFPDEQAFRAYEQSLAAGVMYDDRDDPYHNQFAPNHQQTLPRKYFASSWEFVTGPADNGPPNAHQNGSTSDKEAKPSMTAADWGYGWIQEIKWLQELMTFEDMPTEEEMAEWTERENPKWAFFPRWVEIQRDRQRRLKEWFARSGWERLARLRATGCWNLLPCGESVFIGPHERFVMGPAKLAKRSHSSAFNDDEIY
jgi:hypothetical protein